MECGFLVGNIILTLACVGIVAICREVYLAILWKHIANHLTIKVELRDRNYRYSEIAREYIKWSSINVQICEEHDDNNGSNAR